MNQNCGYMYVEMRSLPYIPKTILTNIQYSQAGSVKTISFRLNLTFKTNITHDRVLRISVNIPLLIHSVIFGSYAFKVKVLKVFLYVSLYSIGWVEISSTWIRWVGWPTRVPHEIHHFSCKISVIVRHLIINQV